jgi:glycosyltransferase involved in cell wall biosynthesis
MQSVKPRIEPDRLAAPGPLRVALIIDDLRVAGAQRVIAQEIRAADPRRLTFRVLVLQRVQGRTMHDDIADAGATIEYIDGYGLLNPRRLWRLAARLRRLQPDLVHTHLTYANTLGTLAAQLAHVPAVATIHNITTNQSRLNAGKRLVEGEVVRRWSSRVIFVAHAALDEAAATFRVPRDRMIALPNAVDLTRFSLPDGFDRARKRRELGADDDTVLVCTVARLDPSKGHRFLLEAAALLAERHPTARYLLAGVGREHERLVAQAGRLGIAGSVALLGVRDDIPELLAACDLFVLPSSNEGLSQAMLEAMALGVPVVATRVGGAPDVVIPGRTGWLVPPEDAWQLAEAIDEALSQPRLAASYARRAGTQVRQEYALDRHVSQLEAVYRDVVAQVGASGPAPRQRGRP